MLTREPVTIRAAVVSAVALAWLGVGLGAARADQPTRVILVSHPAGGPLQSSKDAATLC